MKKYISLLTSLFFLQLNAQVYPSQNINLIGHIHPNTSTVGVGPDGARYSGCWGWYQAAKNKEYAISAGSSGTYFIDISSPSTPTVSDYVPGKPGCIWREIKTFQNFCYVSSDDFQPNRFQIIDMQYLPDSVHVVFDSKSIFERAHTIWIDNDKLYCASVSYSVFQQSSTMEVYSLATPTAPLLLRKLQDDYPFIQYVHDMYVRNDTVFANCANQGMYLFQLTSSNTFTQLGSYINYASESSYNHSSFLTPNGKNVVFCDEIPSGMPIRIVDVQNFSNITPVSSFIPYPTSTPHNPYLINDSILIVSCYQDGLIVYNISDPATPFIAGYFDTYPQGGAPVGNYSNNPFRGNWGAYPWLPSGLIVTNDIQNGVFILDASAAYANTVGVNLPTSTVGVEKFSLQNKLIIYPNPAKDKITIDYESKNEVILQIKNILGDVVFEKTHKGDLNESLWISELKNGTYVVKIAEKDNIVVKKLIVQH